MQKAENKSDHIDQLKLLTGVSRTFALTIPQLPIKLRNIVSCAYLLCRIIDTIEDESGLSVQEKEIFLSRFVSVIKGTESAHNFASELFNNLTHKTPEPEQALVMQCDDILLRIADLQESQQRALKKCVTEMAKGMSSFLATKDRVGLASSDEMDRYCYYVAGIVGEMLTTVFCDYSTKMSANRNHLMALSASFGQGLQMTNILKDIWEDLENNVCWLPRDVFNEMGYDLNELTHRRTSGNFNAGINVLIEKACLHLNDAMRYTQLIPSNETGMRKFCYQSIGIAALTLRKIYYSPGFQQGDSVKISRTSVRTVIYLSQLAATSNSVMNGLFRIAVRNIQKSEDNLSASPF